jgi:hypothetical protein
VTPGTAKLADQFDEFGYPAAYIFRDTVPGTVSVSLTISHDIAWLKSHYKAKLSSNKAIRLAGWSGRILILTAVQDGRKVLIQHIVVGKGSVAYFLDMYGDLSSAKADRALFKKMYGTWRPR